MCKGNHLGRSDAPVVEEPQEEHRKRPDCPESCRHEGEGRPAGQRRGAGAGTRRDADVKTGG